MKFFGIHIDEKANLKMLEDVQEDEDKDRYFILRTDGYKSCGSA